jgi:F0F1-type ATP synthase membrane subunit b/b'
VAARARREIELAKQAALEELHLQSVQLSFDLASQLIQKSLDPGEHQELVEERLRQFRGES